MKFLVEHVAGERRDWTGLARICRGTWKAFLEDMWSQSDGKPLGRNAPLRKTGGQHVRSPITSPD